MGLQQLQTKVNHVVKKNNHKVIEQVITELINKERDLVQELHAIIPTEFKEEHKANPELKRDYRLYWREHNKRNIASEQKCYCAYCKKQFEYVNLKKRLHKIKKRMDWVDVSNFPFAIEISKLQKAITEVKNKKDTISPDEFYDDNLLSYFKRQKNPVAVTYEAEQLPCPTCGSTSLHKINIRLYRDVAYSCASCSDAFSQDYITQYINLHIHNISLLNDDGKN